MERLDQFTRAYLECALFAETDNSDESGGLPLDHTYDVEDFAPEAIERAVSECARFQSDNLEDILKAPEWRGSDSYRCDGYTGLECAGHDFWFTRNGHGVGYWDREYYTQEEKDRLTKASKAYGECWIYIGDDGKLYFC